jgi:hypothetical protein
MPKDFVDRIFNKLFKGREESSDEEMAPIKEKLVRGEKYLEEFEAWVNSDRKSIILDRLAREYADLEKGKRPDMFHIHKSPQADGFFFDERMGISVKEFSYLLDYFKEQTLDQGYTLYSSERHSIDKSESVQTVERHYLKPDLGRDLTTPIDQKYGNVLMEYVAYDAKPAYLKVMVTSYSDRSYSKALDFPAFAEKLFS